MFAAAVGVYRAVEADVWGVVTGDHALGDFGPHFGGEAAGGFLLKPAIVFAHRAGGGKAVVGIAGGATTAWRKKLGHGRTRR